MDAAEIALRVVLGAVIGFSIGLTGVGGGVMVLPALMLLLKLPSSTAVGTASLYSFLTKATASYHHYRLKTIDVGVSLVFLAAAIPANIAVSISINRYISGLQAGGSALARFQDSLRFFIVGVILLSVALLVANLLKRRAPKDRPDSSPIARKVVTAAMGAIVGAIFGATSIGIAVLIIPMFIIVLHMSASRTVGTSIFIGVVLTLTTSAVYMKGGEMDVKTALAMAAGSTVGVYAGSKLSVRMPEKLLQAIVIGVILVAAILMLFKNTH